MKTPEKQAEYIASLCRELYKENDGPRLLSEVMEEFPKVRRVWNDNKGKWGLPATSHIVTFN